uniref:Uncharacterized protein n=1 Tax=Knipowitschia caucasica TaxID=637954 RepID=A0AAV2KPP4_KNICA
MFFLNLSLFTEILLSPVFSHHRCSPLQLLGALPEAPTASTVTGLQSEGWKALGLSSTPPNTLTSSLSSAPSDSFPPSSTHTSSWSHLLENSERSFHLLSPLSLHLLLRSPCPSPTSTSSCFQEAQNPVSSADSGCALLTRPTSLPSAPESAPWQTEWMPPKTQAPLSQPALSPKFLHSKR